MKLIPFQYLIRSLQGILRYTAFLKLIQIEQWSVYEPCQIISLINGTGITSISPNTMEQMTR